MDRSRLTTFELPAYLRACQRMASWANAQLAAGVVELASRPDVIGPDKDIALALREPVGAAQQRIWWSKRLCRRLCGTWKRMLAGDLSERHAKRLVDVTATVDDPELIARIEERILPRSGHKTADGLARAASDTLKRLDPTGTQRRAKAARTQADVALYAADDGMGDVAIHAPIEDAALIKTAVDAYAASAKAGGDDRPIGVLRAEAPAKWATDYLTGGNGNGQPPRAGGRPIEIGITLPLRTALGLDDLPGEVPGLGIIPRIVIAEMIRRELPKLRLLVIDPDSGRLVHRATFFSRPSEMPCEGALARTCSSVATSTARATHRPRHPAPRRTHRDREPAPVRPHLAPRQNPRRTRRHCGRKWSGIPDHRIRTVTHRHPLRLPDDRPQPDQTRKQPDTE